MKRLLTIIMLLCSVSVFGQVGRVPYKSLLQTYRGDTCKTTVESDTVHYYTDLDVFDFNKPITINGASPFINFWMQTGSDIYFNNGNIGSSNMETNSTSRTTRLGINSGLNEDENGVRSNVFIGYESGYSNTIGSENVFLGLQTGYSNTTGSDNVFLGTYSGLYNMDGSDNVFLGTYSGLYNTTGSDNVFLGFQTGYSNIEGSENIFLGLNSGYFNTAGYYNIFLGYYSGYSNTTGSDNVFLGLNSGYSNTTGSNNILIGSNARYYREASNNELVIDALIRGDNPNDSLIYQKNSLIVGKFDADTLNQSVDINGRLRHTATTAEIYRHIDSTARTQSIPNGTTPTKIVVFSDNGVSSHCTADAANDKITITHPGIYDVKLSISYACGTNNVNWFARIFVGGVAAPNIHSEGNTATAGAYRSTSLSGKIKVTTVPVDIDYRVIHDYGSAVNLSFVAANLSVNYNGE